jgi:hypothetical protein
MGSRWQNCEEILITKTEMRVGENSEVNLRMAMGVPLQLRNSLGQGGGGEHGNPCSGRPRGSERHKPYLTLSRLATHIWAAPHS